MYSVFITDDEQTTRNGLLRLFNWAKLGLTVIGEADDGTTALPLIEKLKPDILLTDVRMAVMDGITLSIEAQKRLPGLKVVFISGYSDLNYIKSALKLGACDYILKPVEFTELEQCMSKVVTLLKNEWLARANLQEMESRLSLSLPLIKEHFLASLLKGGIQPGGRLDTGFGQTFMPAGGKRFTAFLLSPDEGELASCPGFQNNWPLLSVALRSIADEILNLHYEGFVMDDPKTPHQIAAILVHREEDEDGAQLFSTSMEICALIKKHILLSTSAAIGQSVDSAYRLHESYLSAGEALKHRLYLGGGRVFMHGQIPSQTEKTAPAGHDAGTSLHDLLLSASEEELFKWVDACFTQLAQIHSTDAGVYRGKVSRLVYDIYATLLEQLTVNGETDETQEGELSRQKVLENLYSMETLGQMQKLVKSYGGAVRSLIAMKNDSKTTALVARVKKTLREKYGENITINDLAAEVYLSPTYLCMLFRQKTGMTINSYQTEVRMEKAKELLSNLSNKLYDVCFAVGYSSPSYFTRQFKKYTGMLPSDFRKEIEEKR